MTKNVKSNPDSQLIRVIKLPLVTLSFTIRVTLEKVAVAPPRAIEDPPVDSEESDCESEAVLVVRLFPRITTSWSTARLPPPVPVLRFLLEGWALQMKNDESVFNFFNYLP